MKNIFAMTAALIMGFGASATNVELVVEAVDNGGIVPGNTYRVYAVLPTAQHSLHAIFAAHEHVLNVATTGSFFQHQYGSSTSLDVSEAGLSLSPGLAFDSWVTVGADNSDNNNLWDIGIDFTDFLAGNELTATDGAWFVVPTDVQAAASVGNKVLLMQLTTDGLTGIAADTKWNVFPNPVIESTFSMQFDAELVLGDQNMIIEATDLTGKIVLTTEYSQEDVIGGNRLVIKHGLAAGTYTLSAKHRDFATAQNFVVAR